MYTPVRLPYVTQSTVSLNLVLTVRIDWNLISNWAIVSKIDGVMSVTHPSSNGRDSIPTSRIDTVLRFIGNGNPNTEINVIYWWSFWANTNNMHNTFVSLGYHLWKRGQSVSCLWNFHLNLALYSYMIYCSTSITGITIIREHEKKSSIRNLFYNALIQ